MQRVLKRLPDRADDKAAHQAAIAKAHLRLGGMDVDVDVAGVAFNEECDDGVAVAREIVEIGGAQGAGEQFVAHGAAVDVEILRRRVALAEGRKSGKAAEANPLP